MHEADEKLASLLASAPTDRVAPLFERHGIGVTEGINALVPRIGRDGANSIAFLFRGGEGVPYSEVVRDVAVKLHVAYSESEVEEEETIELRILEEVIRRYRKNASKEEREQIDSLLNEAKSAAREGGFTKGAGAVSVGAFMLLINQMGKKAVAQLVRKIMLFIVAKQAAREAGKRAAALLGWAVPVLNVALVGWTVIDLAGPAFRKTIPTVIEVALLRLEYGS